MIILNNEKIVSRSGPVKSIFLLKQKIFKNKKIFYIFRTDKNYLFDILVGKKKILNKNFLSIYNLIFKTKIIYINGVFSLTFCLIPLLVTFFSKKKIVISPRGQISPETLVKKKIIKYIYFWFLSFINNNSRSKIFWLVNSSREKNYLQFYLYNSILEITVIENLNDINRKKINIYKKANSLRLFYFSNITKKKNLLDTIEIIKKTHNKKIIFDIYGKIIDTDYFSRIKKAIRYDSNINYKGYVDDNNNRKKVFSNYHYLIHHSLGENYGHVLVESMSYGIPFISNQSHPWIDIDSNFYGYILPRELIYQQVEFLKKLFKIENKTYQAERKKILLYFKSKILSTEGKRLKNYLIFFKKVDKYKFAKK